MQTNSTLADASNLTFVASIVLYAAAMFGYAVEYAFGRKAQRQAEQQPAKEMATVGGGSVEPGADAADTSVDDQAVSQLGGVSVSQARGAGRIATVAMILGLLAHAGSLGLRAGSVGRWPWGNMFEFIVAVALVGVIAWTVLVFRGVVARRLGLFTMLTVVILLGCATRVYTDATPLVPALNSYWIAIHVTAAIIASGVFMVGFVAAVMHLLRVGHERVTSRGGRLRFPFTIAPRLPGSQKLERLTWRMHVLAFPLWTFAIIAGAIWAREAWSRYWGWDPKEVWAFVAWVVYAAYLHSRNTGATGRALAPWIAVIGWGVMLFNLFGVNLLMEGLHSYAF